ncbi:MAG: hypothetical protein NT118_17305, partial [Lentisphaerae bacterium]|nr:hypothetical protein [Lentisphaerota bacterium]
LRRIRNSEILNLKKIPWIKGIGISRSESQNLMNTLTIRVDKETHRSVILGIVKEKGLPQAKGGHMRIISGYNKDKNEIIYSDSWGKDHENKKMPMDDAWTITTGLYSFDPRKK